ncbi:NAD(P)-binding protein [Roseisolibacter sp. H3M3-2]|uniref:NAD(P)-binding protein n=1 Tax=Roseisolibacter sp. H3M3-2 TaxID=3031323 RepID=UPI0023DAE714|nr:NAD(P)-binding protein [Roseisolibacter sp. H3M3-2]MDF1505497.1 NAD(P)-binding protein [Roseisolibacter sp. H3M3-2]
MLPAPLETDYLVVGAGAAALAFVDVLLAESDARVVLADRRDGPGGHWRDAYPFVRLHLPTAWYGVPSTPIAAADDPTPLDRGATGAEVLAYFERLLHERLLPTGRVTWLPGHAHARAADGTHRLTGPDGVARTVRARRVVDATHARTEIPAARPPRYAVAPGVACVAPNALPARADAHDRFTVVGGGKTGMDACLWLLERGTPADRIRWVVPRDPWLHDRDNFRAGVAHLADTGARLAAQLDAAAAATSARDLFARLEAAGLALRLDPAVEPTTWRCAIVSRAEAARLREVHDVVRLGRLRAVEPTRLVLDGGTVPAAPDTLYVDCSAAALQPPPRLPVFDGDAVHLLMVSWCQPVFSASVVGAVEALGGDDAERNALCAPVASPEVPDDVVPMWAASFANGARWARHPRVGPWLRRCRTYSSSVLAMGAAAGDPRLGALRDAAARIGPATENLRRLLAAR